MKAIDLFRHNIPERYQRLLPESVVRQYAVIALDADDFCMTIAMADASDREMIAALRFILNTEVVPVLGTRAGIEFAINRYYGSLP